MTRTLLKSALAAAVVAAPLAVFTANHREAPITALDRAADITDWYSFVSYDDPSKLTMILSVDPLLEPANGPNYFPFDPEILYEMKVDNDQDAVEDVTLAVPLPEPSSATPASSPALSAACSASRPSPPSTVPARRGWASARPTPSPRSAAASAST